MLEALTTGNTLLGRLLVDHSGLRDHIDLLHLKAESVLPRHSVYFPSDSVLASTTADGIDEFLVDKHECTMVDPLSAKFVCRVPGYAYRILKSELVALPQEVFHQQMLRYHRESTKMLSYFATHLARERIAYYLSLFPTGEDLLLTQQQISNAVGTRRETATEVINHLYEVGVLDHTRGRILIKNSDVLLNIIGKGWSEKLAAIA